MELLLILPYYSKFFNLLNMKKTFQIIVVFFIVFFTTGISYCYSQDWPQWRGVNHDGRVKGFKAPKTWPRELAQEWKINVGFGDATPALVNGKIYLSTRQGADEVVLCLDAASGKEIWKNTYSAIPVTGASAALHPGPRSSPAVANGKVVTLGASAILSCLDAAKGTLLWRKENTTNAILKFFTGTSPLIIDGLCIVHLGKEGDGQVIAYDLNTGDEKWKWAGDGPAYSSPSVITIDGKKLLILITEKNVMALGLSDGKLFWQIPAPVQQRFYNCVSPFIDGQTIVYSGQGSGSKAIKVEKQGDGFATKDLWSNAEVGAKWNTPVLKDGFLYGFSDQKRMYCLNYSTGQTAWVDNTVYSDFSTIVDCGSVLIGLTATDDLIVIAPDGKEYKELAKYKVADTPIYAFPVISGNSIYIKDKESLKLLKIK
jgi:outer membrane protein assembly factor BamB